MATKKNITQVRLKELLTYDPEGGIWRFAKARRGVRVGAVAGNILPCGYRILRVDGCNYRSSHLAFLYMKGDWPVDEVDHHNCDQGDDRWLNLREATSSQNKQNTRVSRNNQSGLKGVYPFGNRWRSQIGHERKSIHLGLFDNPLEAHEAYAKKAIELFGEFARAR